MYGAHQALMPVLTSELFDLERFAALYVILQQACLLGSYLLGTRLVRAHAHWLKPGTRQMMLLFSIICFVLH